MKNFMKYILLQAITEFCSLQIKKYIYSTKDIRS